MRLAIINGIMQSYGEGISIDTAPEEGTTFHLFFPISQEPAKNKDTDDDNSPAGTEKILFIDDEVLIAEVEKISLENNGYEVTIQSSSIEALNLFRENPDYFDLIITDQSMPGMTGSVMAREILEIRPDMPIIICSGYSNLINDESINKLGIKAFLPKPFYIKDAAKLIREVLDEKLIEKINT